MVISDLAYADVTFDGYKTPSFLAAPGAIDVGVELTTMSKGYNMAGWRVGFAAGNAEMLRALSTIKGYYDYGMFRPIQIAAIMALRHTDAAVEAQAADLSTPPRRALRRAGTHRLAGRAAQGQHVRLGENARALGVADELVRFCHEAACRTATWWSVPAPALARPAKAICVWRWSRTKTASARPCGRSADAWENKGETSFAEYVQNA